MKQDSNLILIAGGTASGKTLIANKISKSLGKDKVTILRMDDYYKDIKDFDIEKSKINWDEPFSFDEKKLKEDIDSLLSGKTINKRKYNFNSCTYEPTNEKHKPTKYLIIEGLFSLYFEEIRNKAILKVFVDSDSDRRLLRRMERDKNIRKKENFNEVDFIKKWVEQIKPMHNKFIEPTMEHSDIIFKNNIDTKDLENKNKILVSILNSFLSK